MSTSVPLWVPIVVALLGLAGVISTQVIAGRREDRRWRREQEREELRWQREREREQDNRNYEGRAAGYGELIGAIESFDWVLYQARKAVRNKSMDELVKADLREATAEARKSLGKVNVYAPERIRASLRESLLRRSSLSASLLEGKYEEVDRQQWKDGQREYRALRVAMREDLGLDAEVLPAEPDEDLSA